MHSSETIKLLRFLLDHVVCDMARLTNQEWRLWLPYAKCRLSNRSWLSLGMLFWAKLKRIISTDLIMSPNLTSLKIENNPKTQPTQLFEMGVNILSKILSQI